MFDHGWTRVTQRVTSVGPWCWLPELILQVFDHGQPRDKLHHNTPCLQLLRFCSPPAWVSTGNGQSSVGTGPGHCTTAHTCNPPSDGAPTKPLPTVALGALRAWITLHMSQLHACFRHLHPPGLLASSTMPGMAREKARGREWQDSAAQGGTRSTTTPHGDGVPRHIDCRCVVRPG